MQYRRVTCGAVAAILSTLGTAAVPQTASAEASLPAATNVKVVDIRVDLAYDGIRPADWPSLPAKWSSATDASGAPVIPPKYDSFLSPAYTTVAGSAGDRLPDLSGPVPQPHLVASDSAGELFEFGLWLRTVSNIAQWARDRDGGISAGGSDYGFVAVTVYRWSGMGYGQVVVYAVDPIGGWRRVYTSPGLLLPTVMAVGVPFRAGTGAFLIATAAEGSYLGGPVTPRYEVRITEMR